MEEKRTSTGEELSHYDESGRAHMVDVGAKAETRREAVASAFVELSEEVLRALPQNPKGNPLEVARFAGIQAAKRTSELIPMCHPLMLSFVDVDMQMMEGGVRIEATAATVAGTGVEMEAMVAATVAALTVYDMTKALDKGIRIREVVLMRKSGGKSGEYRSLMVDGEATGDLVIDVLGENLFFQEFVGVGIGAVVDNSASHGRGNPLEAFELRPAGGVDVDAAVSGIACEAVADSKNGGSGATRDGGSGVGCTLADTLLTARAGGAAKEAQERNACKDVPGVHSK